MDETAGMQGEDAGADRYRVPVIDRMLDILAVLEGRAEGATIRDLVKAVDVPRSTIYRIMNTLEARGVVERSGVVYALGPRLITFAAHVPRRALSYELPEIARPHLERLAKATGEGSKVSVLDAGATLVLVAVQGPREYALKVTPGQRLPLHAGAGSKVLLAYAPEDVREALLRGPLPSCTGRTFTEAAKLRVELDKVRRQGWSRDRGEFAPNVHAFGAPILDSRRRIVGAVSVPFLAGKAPEDLEAIRKYTIAAAEAIGTEIPTEG
ncbi:MAG TPA: IclR family transcriptional regulator [Inquilinus sp.]|nr:IclR family transcriptional regulator [Inquilinus sp.]